jgi:hypothetical protein
VLSSGWQMPLQACWPVGHMPLQATLFGMQEPLQIFEPLGHAGLQARPSQVTVPPFAGATQGFVHSEGPQVARSLLLAQRVPHWW